MIFKKGNKNRLLIQMKNGKGMLFLNLILPYTCVLTILIFVWIVSNFYVNQNIEKKQISIVTNNIESNIYAVETALEQVENTVFSISQNEEYDEFYEKKNLPYSKKIKYVDMLLDYGLRQEMLEEIFIYSRASDLVINQDGIFESPEEFFEFQYNILNFTQEEWADGIRSGDIANGYSYQTIKGSLLRRDMAVLSYLRTVPLEYPMRKIGAIGIAINKEKLLKGFSTMLTDGNGELYLFNGDELIVSLGEKYLNHALDKNLYSKGYKELKANGEKLYKFVCMDTKNNWRYVIFLDSDYVVRDIASVNAILNAINIISLLLGLAICVYFAYKRSKSNTEIIRMLGVEDEFSVAGIGLNEFEFWKPYLENIIAEKEQMKEKMQNFFESEEHKTLHLLLSKMQNTDAEAENIAKNSGLKFNCQKFMVMVLRSSSTYNVDAINNKNTFFKHVLEEYIDTDFYIYIADFKTTVIVLNYDMDTEEMYMLLKEQIVKMNLEVFYRYHTNVIVGLGEESKLSEIYNSYNQALEAVRYGELKNSKSILIYRELPNEPTMYDYSVEFENRFINMLMNGNTDEALKMVDEIYNNNFVKLTLSVKRTEELFSEVSSSLNKAKRSCLKFDESTEYKAGDFTIRSFFDYVKDFTFSLCKDVEMLSDNTYMNRVDEMQNYIDENYSNSELSLESMATHFGFKKISYMSKVFKDTVGENFSSYLEKKRIEKACEMLLEGMMIREVSEKVGYLSDVSFRRAFKKCMGLSPSDYVISINAKK